MSKRRLIWPVILLAACAQDPESTPIYEAATVERHSIRVSVGSSGVVEPLATVEVKSKASGEVLELLVETGDHRSTHGPQSTCSGRGGAQSRAIPAANIDFTDGAC
jgi:hypothetical protein